jgi:hypothetical protein
MSTNKKRAYFIALGTATEALQLQLDPDIYDADVQTATGLTFTRGAIAKTIKTTIKQAISSSFAGLIRLTVAKGLNTPEEETRQVDIVCETSKLDTAKAALVGKNIRLGYGANSIEWEIVSAR